MSFHFRILFPTFLNASKCFHSYETQYQERLSDKIFVNILIAVVIVKEKKCNIAKCVFNISQIVKLNISPF